MKGRLNGVGPRLYEAWYVRGAALVSALWIWGLSPAALGRGHSSLAAVSSVCPIGAPLTRGLHQCA